MPIPTTYEYQQPHIHTHYNHSTKNVLQCESESKLQVQGPTVQQMNSFVNWWTVAIATKFRKESNLACLLSFSTQKIIENKERLNSITLLVHHTQY
mgnify:CR=1 FL=1